MLSTGRKKRIPRLAAGVSAQDPAPIHILYVDASKRDRDQVRRVLEGEHGGFRVTEADSREAVEARLSERSYDLVLTNFNIPGFEGFQVLEALQAHDPNLPVVIMTGTGSEEVAVEAMKRGVTDYVIKTPQHLQRLSYTLRAAIEQKQLHRARMQAEGKLTAHIHRQAVVVELGQRALAGAPLDALLQEACILVAQTLDLEFCHVMEQIEDRQTLFLRAGVGWEEGLVGHTTLHLGPNAHWCFPEDAEPIIIENLNRKICSCTPPLLQNHGIVSGMNVRIPGDECPFGYLGAYTRRCESFSHEDLHFLQAIANVLAAAIDRKRSESRLSRSEERYRRLVESARDVIYTISKDGRLTSLNPAFETLTGHRIDDWLGRPFEELLHPEDVPTAHRAFARIRDGERPPPYELRIRTADGGYLVSELTSQPNIEHGVFLGVFGIARDISDRKRFEEELIAARDEAEEMSRLKTAFLTNMSHEIRTPLTSIIGFASILTSEVSEEHREFVRLIEQSGQRLLTTLNSVLDLSMLEAGTVKLGCRRVNLTRELEANVARLQRDAARKGLELHFLPAHDEIFAEIDCACLDRILENLVGNAVKFTEAGEITITLAREGDRIEIGITDTGVGIHPSFLPHLFDAFKQENMGIDRPFEGTGLGLSITKRLVELMQGEIRVESRKGQGSTFTVSLPIRPAAVPRPAPAPPDEEPPATARPSVLAIEDNPDMLVLVERFLTPAYDVATALDEEEALALARERRFDVVLMDINLGRARTGIEVLEDLRRAPGYADVPVIAVTAYALPGDREHFLRTGFDGYLGKPFTKPVLRETVAQVLAG